MVNTQMIPYLSKVGYDVVQRGYILAANAILAIAGQFLFGYLCDRFRRCKPFFLLAYGGLVASSFAMFLVEKQWFWYHLLSVSLMAGFVKVIMGLDETWMLKMEEEHYGKLRATGALGLTIGSPIAGFLVHRFPYRSLLLALTLNSVLLLYFLCRVQEEQGRQDKRLRKENLVALLHNSGYWLLVLIYLLVYMIGTADQYVVIDKLLAIQGGSQAVGIKWALQSFMEVPLFLFSQKILQRFSTKALLCFGTIAYALKFVLYGLSYRPWMIVSSATLQLITLPIIMLTSKVLIKEITPKAVFSSAQMFAMAIFIGVSGFLTPLITARLTTYLGYDATLYTVAVFSVVPLLLIYVYFRFFHQKALSKR